MNSKESSPRPSSKKTDSTLRSHVRETTVNAFRDGKFSLRDVKALAREVIESAAKSVDKSIPASRRHVLRQVYDGLSEGLHTAASAGSAIASDAADRARKVATKDAPAAARRIQEANEQLIEAVKSVANKASKQVREELHTIVAKAEKTGPKVTAAARDAYHAADGHWGELTTEAARAGTRAAGRAIGTLASTASGFFDGIAEATHAKPAAKGSVKGKGASTSKPKKKPSTKAGSKSGSKPAKKKTTTKRGKR
ncbi:MAG: DUF6781 family protein [bacterium]